MSSGLYPRFVKRAIDVVVAGGALAVGWPALLGIAAAVRWQLGSPVLFRQPRPGRDGHVFRLYKFRTMTDARGEDGALLTDAERLTSFGRLLRATSLDELPELWNVLRGDMSLVGPRPLLVRYLPRYTPEQARRHLVRPGLTGWAQIHGRNATTWAQRLTLDCWYVDHVSLGLDLRILARTVAAVLAQDGVAHGGHATMPEFTGADGSTE